MKVFTPEISWHERDPIYSGNFHPFKNKKLATAGVSGIIRLWEVDENVDENTLEEKSVKGTNAKPNQSINFNATFIANLRRHNKAVNVVRWSPCGEFLASAGDEAVIFLWKENEIQNQKTLDMEEEDVNLENWFSFKTFRGHLEDILDISWSGDGSQLISGSVDNSVIVWNVSTGCKVAILKEPKGFVQGVICEPAPGLNYAVLSTDRALRVYSGIHKCLHNVSKIQLPSKEKDNKENVEEKEKEKEKSTRLFHDDTMKSFFRRMSYSSDGNMLFTPAGCLEVDDKSINVSYIFTRNNYNKPCIYIPHDRPSVAISCNPFKFDLIKDQENTLFNLTYRHIFAIATEDSVYLYDTQHLVPFAFVTGIHYSNISDLNWSANGRMLVITSIDGFCTFITFKEKELGNVHVEPIKPESIVPVASVVVEVTKPIETPMAAPVITILQVNSIKNAFKNLQQKQKVLADKKMSNKANDDECMIIDDSEVVVTKPQIVTEATVAEVAASIDETTVVVEKEKIDEINSVKPTVTAPACLTFKSKTAKRITLIPMNTQN